MSDQSYTLTNGDNFVKVVVPEPFDTETSVRDAILRMLETGILDSYPQPQCVLNTSFKTHGLFDDFYRTDSEERYRVLGRRLNIWGVSNLNDNEIVLRLAPKLEFRPWGVRQV